ncbi:thiamine pyrophosphate-binding protein [Actinospongicola halichondriae]|uniref:thiamine pyrophosphate-binding protein n=1 Tax=Actinospongicola halichondriae TaxID=3236844 RepID=UPI003D53E893
MTTDGQRVWVRVDRPDIDEGTVATVVAAGRAVCITRTAAGWGALDNRCPHQGGPLGEGQIETGDDGNDYLICPWHAYEYDPTTGEPPEGFGDVATPYAVREATDGALEVELPEPHEHRTLMDQMVDTFTDWGLDAVFGMVGHSNLGLADAFRKAEEAGRLTYIGIRHEGAAAFAASGYAKLTGRPAACFSIAGPGATNLYTGMWDAKVDRVPLLALVGQVQSQVVGPGTFQEIDTAAAFEAVSQYEKTVLVPENANELAALAMKHAIVERDVSTLIFPDDVQNLPAVEDAPDKPVQGRLAGAAIAPPADELARAIEILAAAQKPAIVIGNGARPYREQVIALAEKLDAAMVTTFKAKGTVPDDHPLACGTLGRSGVPPAAMTLNQSDALLVLGASFSNHTSIPTWIKTVQVDFDRMMLGKFHAVDVPLWGEIGRTLELLGDGLEPQEHPDRIDQIASRWARYRKEKSRRSALSDSKGRLHPALVMGALQDVVPDDAVIAVDVGNNTYSFGHFFECRGRQDVLMSGYLGSIGFALPAAMGAWVAIQRQVMAGGPKRRVVSISGDGGLGQYLAEFTTAVNNDMDLVHIVLDNSELAKISREQLGVIRPVWKTDLTNPDFAEYARLCGGEGFRVSTAAELRPALEAAFAVEGRPALVSIAASNRHV